MRRYTSSGTQNNPVNQSHLMRERDLAARWGISRRTLQRWRAEHYGPPFVRIGGSIRYILTDVIAFEERKRHDVGGEHEG